MLQQMGFNKIIFLHFFDIHFLEYKGVRMSPSFKNLIYDEARLATRLAFLMADELLVPAASYFESEICSSILSEFYCNHTFNGIYLVANALNFEEFKYRKLFQYPRQSHQYRIYKNLEVDTCPPLHPRKHSSTKDIINSWQNCLSKGVVVPTITRQQNFAIPGDIETRWEKVPDRLEQKAFTVEHVAPLLFEDHCHPTLINSLHSVIDKYYFSSYVDEFNTGIIRDLEYLASGYEIPSIGFCFSFRLLQRISRSHGFLNKIWEYDTSHLIELKNSPEWTNFSTPSIILPPKATEINQPKMSNSTCAIKGISIPDAAETFISFVNRNDKNIEEKEKINAQWKMYIKRNKPIVPIGTGKGKAILYDINDLAYFIKKKEKDLIPDSSFDNFITALTSKAQTIKN